MFVVLGSSGNTGSIVATGLLDAGKKVRLVVRDASKVAALAARGAEVVTGNVEDASVLGKAFAGAEGVYALLPPDSTSTAFVARGERLATALASAIAEAKVPHVVFLSSVGAHLAAGTGPIVTVGRAETKLRAIAATKFTFLRPAYFMENVLGMLHPMKADGVLPNFGATTKKFDMIATRDIGKAALEALLDPAKETRVIELTGPQTYSIDDVAAAFATALGRDVKANELPFAAMIPTLTQFGFSNDVAALYLEMTEAMHKGTLTFDGTPKRTTTTIAEFARAVIG